MYFRNGVRENVYVLLICKQGWGGHKTIKYISQSNSNIKL